MRERAKYTPEEKGEYIIESFWYETVID